MYGLRINLPCIFCKKKNWGNPYWPTMKMENKKEDMKESKKKQNS